MQEEAERGGICAPMAEAGRNAVFCFLMVRLEWSGDGRIRREL